MIGGHKKAGEERDFSAGPSNTTDNHDHPCRDGMNHALSGACVTPAVFPAPWFWACAYSANLRKLAEDGNAASQGMAIWRASVALAMFYGPNETRWLAWLPHVLQGQAHAAPARQIKWRLPIIRITCRAAARLSECVPRYSRK